MGADQPQRIAERYELTQAISTGGMGQVWRGFDTVLDRDIAVKLIRPDLAGGDDRDELIARFRREARVTARIEHAGVPAVFDAAFDVDADRLYMVMQLVHGVSLADVIAERGGLPVGWAVSIAAQLCAVLSYAHAVPVVHRDLKPGNIMIAADGAVKVLDFGVAAVLRSDATRLTSTGRVVGTKPYMSPEQIRNTPVTPQTDLYALGCVLHELLTGERVFDGETEVALMYQHLEGAPTPLRHLRPEVPEDIERLVADLLAKNPEDRPASAWAVYDRLAPHLPTPAPVESSAGDVASVPGGIPDPTWPYRRPMSLRPRPATRSGPDSRSMPAVPLAPVSAPAVGDAEIDAALDRAEDLIEDGRFTQAADGLAEILSRAATGRPADSPAVLQLRSSLAATHYLGGDYRSALRHLDGLAAEFARTGGADDERALDCRRQAADCRVRLGHATDALRNLQAVYAARQRNGRDLDEEVLELRYDIATLQVSTGQSDRAAAALPDLYRDARRVLGEHNPLTDEINTLLIRHGPRSGPAP